MGAALHVATQRQFGDLWSPPGDLILLLFLWGHSRVIILNKNKVILILKTVCISFPIPYKSLGTRGQSIIVLTLVVEAAVEVSNWNRGTEMLLGEDDAYRVWEINKGSHKGKPTVAWWNRLLLLALQLHFARCAVVEKTYLSCVGGGVPFWVRFFWELRQDEFGGLGSVLFQ